MSKRVVMRIELTPPAKKKLTDLAKRRGMTQVAVASRLMEWFALQPESIQAAILGQYPSDVKPDVVRMLLERMAEES